MLSIHVVPSGLQKSIIIHVVQLDPSALPPYLTEYPVLVLSIFPIQGTVFSCSFDSPRRCLTDVDVGQAIFLILSD